MASTAPFTAVSLVLTGIRWHIHAGDAEASPIVAALGEAMCLPPAAMHPATKNKIKHHRELLVFVDPESGGFSSGGYTSGPVFCFLPLPGNNDMLVLGMSYIAMTIARAELSRGSLLVHGALAQGPNHLGGGVILAGSGTVGKSTASKRLPAPWLSLSDDSSLLVRDDRGQYMAHPWPTWSRFYCDPEGRPGPGDKWDVQCGVPLRALFFLAQAEEDRIAPLLPTPAVTYLMETVQHISSLMTRDLPVDEAQSLYKGQLAAAEQLIRTLPAYTLHLSLNGFFWNTIEKTLEEKSSGTPGQSDTAVAPWGIPGKKKNSTQPPLFDEAIKTVLYSGSSMNPTLRYPDILEVIPYTQEPIRVGDVVYFPSPEDGQKTIHRVVRISGNIIHTRGDNNSTNDPYFLQPDEIIGRVTTAWRHDKRRIVSGSIPGIWSGYKAVLWRWINSFFSSILHKGYHALAASNLFRFLLPASFHPRVFEFKQRNQTTVLKLMVNGRVVGHYDIWKRLWVIDRPWRLVVDETLLPAGSIRTTLHQKNTAPEL